MSPFAPVSRRALLKYTAATVAAAVMPPARSTRWTTVGSLADVGALVALADAGTGLSIDNAGGAAAPALPSRSNFHAVYDDPAARDRFVLFLQHVYHLYPERAFHQLILDTTREFRIDQEIYQALQTRLPGIKPLFSQATYGLPALRKQKAEMARQTADLLKSAPPLHGYVEIGTPGRYTHGVRKAHPLDGPVYLVHDAAPGFSPNDIAERGQVTKVGTYVPLGDYDPFDGKHIPPESVDLVTVYIGFHHAPPDKRTRFIQAVWHVLRPGGRLIVRDHDVNGPEMDAFVALAHDVFNAGLNLTWAENASQIRNFTSVPQLEAALGAAGFEPSGTRLLQDYDPTQNTLMAFVKPAQRAR